MFLQYSLFISIYENVALIAISEPIDPYIHWLYKYKKVLLSLLLTTHLEQLHTFMKMMFAKLPQALAFLLFASILASAQSFVLRTRAPYIMRPVNRAYGGVAPARIRNEECPSLVKLRGELDNGVRITFSTSAYDSGESVIIDENTDVYISFNASVCKGRKTWAHRFAAPMPPAVGIELATLAEIYVPIRFRIKRSDIGYSVYSPHVDSDGNVKLYYPVPWGNTRHLVLSSEVSSFDYDLFGAQNYEGVIKSVV